MAFGDLIQVNSSGNTNPDTEALLNPVVAGNTIVCIVYDGGESIIGDVSDDINTGIYTKEHSAGEGSGLASSAIYFLSNSIAGTPTITLPTNAERAIVAEFEGAFASAAVKGAGTGTGTALTTTSGTIPASSVSIAAIGHEFNRSLAPDAPWTEHLEKVGLHLASRQDASSASISFSGTLSSSTDWAIPWAAFIVESAITVSVGPGGASPGGTIDYSTTNLGTITSATLTDGSSNVLPLTSVTDTSAAVPAIANEQQYCLFGTVTLTVSDGTNSATTTLTLSEPAAYIDKEILIANPDTTENGYLFGTSPDNGQANPYEGMQVLADVAINNDGTYEAPSDGTYNFVIIDDFDGWMETYTLTVGAAIKLRRATDQAFGISRRLRVGL